MEATEISEEREQKPAGEDLSSKKKFFVAGATRSTEKRIIEKSLAKGFAIKAGVRDLDKAKASLSHKNPTLQIVKADVTEDSVKLAEAIGDDSKVVICATGFRPGGIYLLHGRIPDQVAEVAVEALAYPESFL